MYLKVIVLSVNPMGVKMEEMYKNCLIRIEKMDHRVVDDYGTLYDAGDFHVTILHANKVVRESYYAYSEEKCLQRAKSAIDKNYDPESDLWIFV
jgi:hypothetical protein